MQNINRKIDNALQQQPDYTRLDNLSRDVWQRVTDAESENQNVLRIPKTIQAGAVALCFLALIALSQVSLRPGKSQTDIFDLRYFSYRSIPSANLVVLNYNEFRP